MQKLFLKGLGITLLLNLLVKPATIFLVDVNMQNILHSEVYGTYQIVLNFTFLFSMLLDMGITNYMTRLIAQHPHMIHKYSNRLFTFRLILVLIYVLWTVTLYFIMQFPIEWLWILGLLIMHQISIITVNYVRAYTGGLLKFELDAFLSVAERSLYFVLGLMLLYGYFVETITLPWFIGIFVASSTFSLVVATVIYVRLVSIPKISWKPIFFLSIFKQSYPYAILVILMMLTIRLDAVFIKLLLPEEEGPNQVAYYIQSFRLLDACWMFGVLFGSILLPVFSRVLKDKGSTTGIMTSAFNLLLSGGIIMIAFTIGIREEIFNKIYTDANYYSYTAWIFHSLAFIPMCFTIVFGTLLTANGSMRRLNQMALISLLVMIILNCCLVPFFGAIGAAIAMLISQLTLGVLQYFEVKLKMKHHLAKYTWRKIGGLALVLGTILYMQRTYDLGVSNFILLLGGVWLAMIFSLRIIDVKQIIGMLQKKGS